MWSDFVLEDKLKSKSAQTEENRVGGNRGKDGSPFIEQLNAIPGTSKRKVRKKKPKTYPKGNSATPRGKVENPKKDLPETYKSDQMEVVSSRGDREEGDTPDVHTTGETQGTP